MVLQSVAEDSRRRRSRFNRARNLNRVHRFDGARHVHRKRNEKNGRHHKRHGTHSGRFVSLAAIHRAVAHPSHVRGHVVPAIFMRSSSRRLGRRRVALVMVLGNVAETLRAACHQRRRKRSRGQRRIKDRNRQQTSQRADQSVSVVFLAIQDRPDMHPYDNPVEAFGGRQKMSRVCNSPIPRVRHLS